jgi:hypothetical protein
VSYKGNGLGEENLMAKIHIPGDGHISPSPVPRPNGQTAMWLPFSDAKKKKVVSDALFILTHNVKGSRPCNDCFSRLPNGRTFDDVMNDASVFISFDPSTSGRYATTSGNDITITDFSIRQGR